MLRPITPRSAAGSVAVTAAALALVVASTAPAHAQVRTVADPTGDGSSDIVRVRVAHTDGSLKLKVTAASRNDFAHWYDVWVDTGGSPAPDFVVTAAAEVAPRVSVSVTSGFGDLQGATRCTVRTARTSFATRTVRFSVPRSCLRAGGVVPGRVRVSVEASDEVGRHDWVPGQRRFTRWVRSG